MKVQLTVPEECTHLLARYNMEGGSTGTHGDNASYILSSASQHVDKFIDEYLRVSADACRGTSK